MQVLLRVQWGSGEIITLYGRREILLIVKSLKMRHFDYLSTEEYEELFYVEPMSVNRNSEKEILAYGLGATLYSPATRITISNDILLKKHEGLVSMVLCLEDSIGDHEVVCAEETLVHQIMDIYDKLQNELIEIDEIPLLFVRIRSVDQMKRIIDKLGDALYVLTGFVFPKFTSKNAEQYLSALQDCNSQRRFPVYGMPILESSEIIYRELRIEELLNIKRILDKYQDLILNIRIGATDFSSLFGLRRGPDVTIYDIAAIRDCIGDIVNVFTRKDSTYVVSGPVWEYFVSGNQQPFQQQWRGAYGKRLAQQVLNQWHDALIKEVLLDKENGLIGKTTIHPSHLKIVHSLSVISREEYEDALSILKSDSNGVLRSNYSNKMNEVKPHTSWARKTIIKSQIYGVYHGQNNFINLLARTAKLQLQNSR